MGYFLSLQAYDDLGTLALRAAVGAIFLAHGLAKRAMWTMRPSPQMPAPMLRVMRLLSICEPLGALAMFAGFLTQLAAACLAVVMLGAIGLKVRVMKAPFKVLDKGGWAYDLMILAACASLVLSGPGAYSLDRLLFDL